MSAVVVPNIPAIKLAMDKAGISVQSSLEQRDAEAAKDAKEAKSTQEDIFGGLPRSLIASVVYEDLLRLGTEAGLRAFEIPKRIFIESEVSIFARRVKIALPSLVNTQTRRLHDPNVPY